MPDGKYVCAYSDGITPIGVWQMQNYNPLTQLLDGDDVYFASSQKQAASLFEAFNDLRERCCVPTEEGGPWVMVYPKKVDGIEPDAEAIMRLTVGPKLGIRVEQLS